MPGPVSDRQDPAFFCLTILSIEIHCDGDNYADARSKATRHNGRHVQHQPKHTQGYNVAVAVEEEEEDAWVNDVGPSIHSLFKSERDIQDEQTIPLAAAPFDWMSARSQEYVGPEHPLWSLVQRLSERIWRETHLQQEAGLKRRRNHCSWSACGNGCWHCCAWNRAGRRWCEGAARCRCWCRA